MKKKNAVKIQTYNLKGILNIKTIVLSCCLKHAEFIQDPEQINQ